MNIEPGKKEYICKMEHDAGRLMLELWDQVPGLAPVKQADGTWQVNVRMFTSYEDGAEVLTLWIPEATDPALIQAVMMKHVKYPPVEDPNAAQPTEQPTVDTTPIP